MEKEKLEEEPQLPRAWPIEIGPKGEIIGLPEGIKREDVILRIESDGSWWAYNPSQEIIEEIKKWRSDWMDVE